MDKALILNNASHSAKSAREGGRASPAISTGKLAALTLSDRCVGDLRDAVIGDPGWYAASNTKSLAHSYLSRFKDRREEKKRLSAVGAASCGQSLGPCSQHEPLGA